MHIRMSEFSSCLGLLVQTGGFAYVPDSAATMVHSALTTFERSHHQLLQIVIAEMPLYDHDQGNFAQHE